MSQSESKIALDRQLLTDILYKLYECRNEYTAKYNETCRILTLVEALLERDE